MTSILNTGSGEFAQPIRTPESLGDVSLTYIPTVVLGNFRGKFSSDIVYLGLSPLETNVLAFIPSNGDGTYGSAAAITTTLNNPYVLAAGDFNGDKKLDFVVISQAASVSGIEVDMFLGNGDGTFKRLAPEVFPETEAPSQIFAGDFNHDGKLDLLLGFNDDGIAEFLGNGDGTFAAPTTLFAHFGGFQVADVNRDGYLDLIQARAPAATPGEYGMYPTAVTIYLGRADGTFAQQTPYQLPGYTDDVSAPILQLGDFNGDGILDIGIRYYDVGPDQLFGAQFQKIRILQGIGDGTFVVGNHALQLQNLSNPVVGADFNGDGKTDLIDLDGFTSAIETIPAAQGPSLDIAFDDGPLVSNSAQVTVTLNYPQASDTVVALSASDPAVTLPATLSFAAGTTSKSFTLTTAPTLDRSHAIAVYATLGAETAVAYSMTPNPNAKVGVHVWTYVEGTILAPGGIVPGQSFNMTLFFQSLRGYFGDFSGLRCSGLPAGASCTFDLSSVKVTPGGAPQVNFTLNTSSSAPFGTYPIVVSATDGHITPQTSFTLGIGDFSLSASPTVVVVGAAGGSAKTNVNVTATNGLNQPITLDCTGLASSDGCGVDGGAYPGGVSPVVLFTGAHSPGNIPFQIRGTLAGVTHSIPLTLQVEDFKASIDKTSATISAGGSATFTITLSSVNQYSNSVSVACSESSGSVTLTCTPSPKSVALAAGGTQTVTLTVTAPASAGTKKVVARKNSANLLLGLAVVPLFFLVGGKKPRIHRVLLSLMLCAALWSCGGGGGSGGGISPPPPPPTKTVQLSVDAFSALQTWDQNNTKPLGPLTITVQ